MYDNIQKRDRAMAKTSITMRIDETKLRAIDAWRERERFPIDRTAIVETGLDYFLMVNQQPDGTLELLEDLLAYYSDAAPAQFRDLAEKTLKSVAKDLAKETDLSEDAIAEMARAAAATVRAT
jgi:hypothetical protein